MVSVKVYNKLTYLWFVAKKKKKQTHDFLLSLVIGICNHVRLHYIQFLTFLKE